MSSAAPGSSSNPNPRVDLDVHRRRTSTRGGNLPFDDMVELLPLSLDTFWLPAARAATASRSRRPTLERLPGRRAVPRRATVARTTRWRTTPCSAPRRTPSRSTSSSRVDLYDQLGDLSFSYPIAAAYSDAVQTALGTGLEGEPRVLLDDCLVGAWIVDIVPVAGVDPPRADEPRPADRAVGRRPRRGRRHRGDPRRRGDEHRRQRDRVREDRRVPHAACSAASPRARAASADLEVSPSSSLRAARPRCRPTPASPGMLAALDMGTNSFHLVVAA